MSTVLDSPLVALAFDYASFGFLAAVNSSWTWIVIISTAALSFWRIRASTTSAVSSRVSEETLSSSSSPSCEDEIVNADRSCPQPASRGTVKIEFEFSASTSPYSPSSLTWFECDGSRVTKGKFATYYEEDQTEDEPPAGALASTTIDEAEFGGREWWWSWGREVRLRNGERGWYKFQDLRAINGNVVRLWDES